MIDLILARNALLALAFVLSFLLEELMDIQMLAAISGSSLVNVLVWIVVAGVIFWLCNWLISYVGIPEPFNKVAKVVLTLIVFIVLVNALLTLAGHPMVTF